MMKKIFLTIFLLLAAAVSGTETMAKDAPLYTEKGYFTVKIPSGWEKREQVFGLSEDEKKVYGADFLAAGNGGEITPRISVHYYAPGNIIHKTAEKFIKTHAEPVLGTAEDGEIYGQVKEGTAGGRRAKIFDRNTFDFFPPESINQKKIPVYEKFAVVPAKTGFYVLTLRSPADASIANLKVYESALASFRPLLQSAN